jgi:hypothetical protein
MMVGHTREVGILPTLVDWLDYGRTKEDALAGAKRAGRVSTVIHPNHGADLIDLMHRPLLAFG